MQLNAAMCARQYAADQRNISEEDKCDLVRCLFSSECEKKKKKRKTFVQVNIERAIRSIMIREKTLIHLISTIRLNSSNEERRTRDATSEASRSRLRRQLIICLHRRIVEIGDRMKSNFD